MVGRDAVIAVYIMTDKPRGTLYTGVTSRFLTRIVQHRDGVHEGFTKKYDLKRLVWFEHRESMIGPSSARNRSSAGRATGRSI